MTPEKELKMFRVACLVMAGAIILLLLGLWEQSKPIAYMNAVEYFQKGR